MRRLRNSRELRPCEFRSAISFNGDGDGGDDAGVLLCGDDASRCVLPEPPALEQ